MGNNVFDQLGDVRLDFWPDFPEYEKAESMNISYYQYSWDRGGGEEGDTRSDKEKPANNVDVDLETTTSFKKVHTDGGKTKSQIDRMRGKVIQDHGNNDEIDTTCEI